MSEYDRLQAQKAAMLASHDYITVAYSNYLRERLAEAAAVEKERDQLKARVAVLENVGDDRANLMNRRIDAERERDEALARVTELDALVETLQVEKNHTLHIAEGVRIELNRARADLAASIANGVALAETYGELKAKYEDMCDGEAGLRDMLTTAQRALSGVISEIANERQRQMDAEGHTLHHDDQHRDGQLADAAACYAMNFGTEGCCPMPRLWPWSLSFWKPKSRRHDLIRAAALIVAEIERLDRTDYVEEVR